MRIQKKITVDICPFNVKHQYTKDEMRVHLRDCPDKFRLMTEKIYMECNIELKKEKIKIHLISIFF